MAMHRPQPACDHRLVPMLEHGATRLCEKSPEVRILACFSQDPRMCGLKPLSTDSERERKVGVLRPLHYSCGYNLTLRRSLFGIGPLRVMPRLIRSKSKETVSPLWFDPNQGVSKYC